MPTYGKIKVNTLTYDASGTATDVPISTIATDTDLALKANLAGPTFTGTINGASLILSGDLTVNGSTTTIDTTTLQVEDKNIQIGKVSTPSNATADGGGITLLGGSDGDKTINWVNSTDAWTFSENINIAANKKLGIGGANYGTSGQVLTSGGSGAAPTWSNLPAAGATIDLVADGAIAAGKAVIVNSSGKAEQVKFQATMQNSGPSIYIGQTTFQNNEIHSSDICYDPDLSTTLDKSVFWMIYRHTADSAKMKLKAALGSGWPQDLGDTVELNSSGATSIGSESIAYDTHNDKVICAYRANNKLNMRTATVTGTASSAITLNTEVELYNGGYDPRIAYASNGKFLVIYKVSSSSYEAKVGTIASNGTITFGTAAAWLSGSEAFRICVSYGSNIDKFLIAYAKASDSQHGYCRVATISGTSVSYGTEVEFENVNCEAIDVDWDTKNQKFVVIYASDSTQYLYARQGTVSGTSISFGNATQISGNFGATNCKLAFSPLSNTFLATYKKSTNSNRMSARNFEINGSGFTVASTEATNLSPDALTQKYGLAVPTLVDSNEAYLFAGYTMAKASNGDGLVARLNYMDPGSNLTSTRNNFVGFAPSAVNDGATGTFNLPGNTVGNQSGLTAGSGYALTNDGTLGAANSLTNSNVGITALTSTTGIIRGY